MTKTKKSWIDSRVFYRILESLPALISWSVLILPFLLAFSFPFVVAVFFAFFAFFWFLNTLEYIYFVIVSQFNLRRNLKKDFGSLLKKWDSGMDLPKDIWKNRQLAIKNKDFIKSKDVKHLIFIATYKEPFVVLDESLQSISKTKTNLKNIYICLAAEARAGQEQAEIVERIKKKYQGVFGKFWLTFHPANLPGEVQGKGGNITFAGKQILGELEKEGEKIQNIIVTTLDADHQPHLEYFNFVTLSYVQDEYRQNKSYQPISLFYNNIWDVPVINRLLAVMGGFWHMAENTKAYKLRNFASHSQPLLALKNMNFWAVNTIVEDGHQYWRSYFHFNGEYEVEPVFLPVYQDAVQSQNYKTSLISQYKQIRRWAWGASDIPFVIYNWIKNFKKLPFFETLMALARLFEAHIFWATAAIIITLATPLPEYINPEYARSLESSNVSAVLGFLFKAALFGILLAVLLSLITLPKPKNKKDYFKIPLMWIMIPIATIIFGSIPALESQTRLLLGKYLGFDVTEKHRTTKK